MKGSFLFCFICTQLFQIMVFGQIENDSSEKAEKMLRDFYSEYIVVFASEATGAEEQAKLKSLQEKYCTEPLLKKIPKIIERTDADPFLKAQDSDVNFLKTLRIERDSRNKNQYNVSYSYMRLISVDPDREVKETVAIRLIIVNQKGNYKIDSILE